MQILGQSTACAGVITSLLIICRIYAIEDIWYTVFCTPKESCQKTVSQKYIFGTHIEASEYFLLEPDTVNSLAQA